MHRLKPLRWLAFSLGLGVALAIAGAGVRPGRGLEVVGGWSTDGTCSFDAPNPTAGNDYELEFSDIILGCTSDHLLAGTDERGLPIISGAAMTSTKPVRHLSSHIYDSTGEELVELEDRWLICPTGARLPEPEVLIWWPESWYEPASKYHRNDCVRLFRENYAQDFKLIHGNNLMRALRAASRGNSLAVYTRLLAVVPGEPERFRIPMDPLFSAEGGIAFTDGTRHLAVLATDGGFHNVDTFYMLFDQPALEDGAEHQLLGTEDIEGGYRGIFAVDLDEGTMLWTTRTGLSPVYTHAADVNGDGLDEFLVQCYSSENGVSGGGTTDAGCSYVLCLDQSGNILWKKRFVGVHIGVMAAIANVTGDARPEVVVVCSSTRDTDMGHAAVLSGDGETLVERSDLGGLYGIAVADFDGDGYDEVVSGGPDGSVVMLDGELNVVASFKDTVDHLAIPNWTSYRHGTVPDMREIDLEQCYKRLVPLAAFDLDGDGDIETMGLWTAIANVRWTPHERGSLFPPRGDLVVLDSSLREERRVIIRSQEHGLERAPADAPASLKTNIYPVDMNGDGVREVLLSNGNRGLLVFSVTRAEGGQR